MTTVCGVCRNLIPRAIIEGNALVQEHSIGTTKEDLFYPLVGRARIMASVGVIWKRSFFGHFR